MSHLLPWLTDNVRSAAEKCGALGASVYVPTPWNLAAPGILVHVGTADPLPEMATIDAALAFAVEAASRLAASTEGGNRPTASAVPSSTPEGCFLPIPLLATLWQRAPSAGSAEEPSKAQLRRLSDRGGGPPIVGWLGLRFAEPSARVQYTGGWQSLLELASALASTYVCFYGILTDPVTGLPGRAELNGTVRAELDRAATNGLPFSLVFVKLENLDDVNARLGRQAGDAVLREFLEGVHGSIRNSDTVMRYGGAIFALPLRDVAPTGAVIVGEKIRRRIAAHQFLEGALRLPCAVGVAAWEPGEDAPVQALEMLSRADQALSVARRDGCGQAVLWRADGTMATAEHLDPLLGVFTGQAEKDYRNMRLLWGVLQALSGNTGVELSRAVVGKMFSLFAATRAALFQPAADRHLVLISGQQRLAESGTVCPLASDDIRPEEWRLNEDALTALAPRHCRLDVTGIADGPAQLTAYAVPLVIEGRALGTLYLLGGSDVLKIDQTDFPVLGGVASQLALAIDREQLAATQRLRDQQEQQRLMAELHRLRTVLKQTSLVFRSKVMADLLNTTSRVAATDATVLITGESGTGKELLARTLHEVSSRRDRPLVIVDCGAIPVSLMDSELFGRERGAYTGAERRAAGRLAQADGGTVFLDEIGELPLEVQAKLLRFVQEKTITMVGSPREQRVDVRIVAATNRPLEGEVRAGRFREDLFHRLNVVRLRIPSLRERPDDVLFLARHFLEIFARDYAKGIRDLDPGAERLLEAYDWPGNVRELQNTILQAVVLAERDVLTADDLRLPGGTPLAHADRGSASHARVPNGRVAVDSPERSPNAQAGSAPPRFHEAWQILVERLGEEVDAAVSSGSKLGPPLGKWLSRDLVLEAHQHTGGVAAKAASCIGLPETTFSRRLRQAEAEAATTRRPESWAAVSSALSALLRAEGRPSGVLTDQLDDLLLGLVVARTSGSVSQAAGLMGVSVPTMKRRIEAFHQNLGTPIVCA